MATFTRRPNGFIYLVHSIDHNHNFRISTTVKVVDPNDWDKKNHRPKDPAHQYNGTPIATVLDKYMSAFNKAYVVMDGLNKDNEAEFKIKPLSYLKPEERAERGASVDLITYFEGYNKKLKAKQQSNFKSYQTCLNHLRAYKKNKPLPFSSVDYKLYEGFMEHLVKENMSMNYIATLISRLKTVMNRANFEGLHTNTQYRNFKRRMESTDTIYLSEEDLEKIYRLSVTGHLEKARDYFIIGAYTGLRFDDWIGSH